MRCCVQSCKNHTRRTTKRDGITFHVFPKEPCLRTKWIEALGNMDWEPKYHSLICSEHFRSEDFHKTKFGLRKIKNGAIPVVVQDSSGELNSSAVLKVCRICLAMDRKLYHIIDYKLDLPYQQITGLTISEDDNLPQKLCWECRHRLESCQWFRCKAIMSQRLMSDVLETEKYLTVRRVKSVSQSKYGLSSTLKQKHYRPAYCDIYIKEEEAIKPYMDDVIDDDVGYKEALSMKDELNHDDDDEGILIKVGSEFEIKEEVQSKISTNIKQNESEGDQNKVSINVNAIGHGEFVQNSRSGHQLVKLDDVIKVYVSDVSETTSSSGNGINDGNLSSMEQEVKSDEEFEFLEETFTSISDCSLESDGEEYDEILKVEAKKTRMQSMEKKKKPVKLRKKDKDNKKRIKNKDTDGKSGSVYYALIDSRFTVTKLTFEEQLEEISKRKDSVLYKNAPYKCETCYRGFPYKNTWEVHNRLHNKDSGEFECQICKTRYMTRTALKKHISNHAEKLSCNRCDFVTKHRVVARQHIEWHDGITFKCQRCPSEFKNRSTYLSHLRLKHVTDYVCELCGYAFLNEKGVYSHKKRQHNTNDSMVALDGPYCEVCEVRFASETAYDTHLKVSSKHSTDDDPNRIRNEYSSMDLTQVRKARKGRKRAWAARSKPQIVECEQCGAQLEGLKNYMYHFKREHPDKHRTKYTLVTGSVMCDQCGKIFQSKELLLNHMWMHTGEKRFKCLLCDKSFSHQRGLMLHQLVHNGQTPVYDCKICGKEFSFASNRSRHMSVHSELKPFKCDVCEKTFKTNAERRAHYDHVHLKKPWPSRSQRTRDKGEQKKDQP